jgi:NAD(P)-dependent dehydrogenase (short-subunit alcohol dehydrogenase family)/acyl dehydratase/putative sterol carrier protein
MDEQLRYDGKVVIVTGAGNGLGRSYALMFGARGARVVVNDLGGGAHGGGGSSAAADKVVAEIEALGGQAVANCDSVEDGARIVQAALDAFGTVDIVINNAGILRDVSFQKMSDDDWNLILRVHLNGSKSVTQAAWPIMRAKGYGRIVMTTSAAGIYGNYGQANYCAAKLGILGLANCLAEEGRGKNILVNTIAPIAASRLTETVMPPELLENLSPEFVAPLVGWLAHEKCEETKGLFEVGAGYFAKLRWERTRGYAFAKGRALGPDDIAAKWDQITDFTDAEHPATINDTLAAVMAAFNAKKLGGNEFIDLDVAMSQQLMLESSYDERDLALYALGVGAARDPMDDSERKFVYELGDFQALPTYGVMPQSNAMLAKMKEGTLQLPGMNFGFERLLHGEQYTEIKRPLPTHAKLRHVFKLKHAYDKNPNAVVVFGISSVDESGEEIIYNEMTGFVKGAGGWGGERGPDTGINTPPDRAPDAVMEEKTDPNQTLLYRLSGDWNPLHVDPAFARAFGYERPILHGMCTYGYVGRHVIKALLDNDPRRFKSIKVRFAEPVFPGETLVTRMWKESDTRVIIETRVKERDKVVIRNAAVELHAQIAQAEQAVTSAAAAAPQDERLLAEDVFAVIGEHVAAQPDLAGKTGTLFQFHITNPESTWVLDLKNGNGDVRSGSADKPDVTLELDLQYLPTLVTASLGEVQKLFFGGQLKVSGNVMASNKLTVLQAIDKNEYDEARVKRLGSAAAATAGTPAAQTQSAPPKQARAGEIFAALGRRLAADANTFNGAAGAILQFNVRAPDSVWTIDFSGEAPTVEAGPSAKATTVLGIDDGDLASLAKGEADARDLYQHGKLRVDGDVGHAHALAFFDKLI